MITSRLIVDRLIAPSQVQVAMERIGGTDFKWFGSGVCYADQTHYDQYLHFKYKGEERQLQYFFTPACDKGHEGLTLSVNWWGSDQEIMAALKGAFGGKWYRDDDLTELEPRAGMEDIMQKECIEGRLIFFIFSTLITNCQRLGVPLTFFQLYDHNKLDFVKQGEPA